MQKANDSPPEPNQVVSPTLDNSTANAGQDTAPLTADYFAPTTPTTPAKKFGGGKLVATFLGILLLVGGIATGVILVQNPQLLEEKAFIRPGDRLTACGSINQRRCSTRFITGATRCISPNDRIMFCCGGEMEIYNFRCTPPYSISCSTERPCIDKNYVCDSTRNVCVLAH